MNRLRSALPARSPTWRSTKLGVDPDFLAGPVGGGEAHLVEHPLHHRLQPARADVLDRAIDLGGDARDRRDRVVGEVELDAFGPHQRHILLDEARLGVGEDALEILLGQGIELDADRQAALQLGQEVGGPGDVEGAGGDEQDMVGLDRSVLGRRPSCLRSAAGGRAARPRARRRRRRGPRARRSCRFRRGRRCRCSRPRRARRARWRPDRAACRPRRR